MTQTNLISLKEYKSIVWQKKRKFNDSKKCDEIKTMTKSKYNAIATTVDGYRFHSKKEAQYYLKLKDQQSKGEIARFHPQVTFLLPGGIKHHVDFMVIEKWGGTECIEYIEVKGRDTPMGKLKRKQVEQIYGIEIKVV